jgi:hypothetical protein
MYIGSGAERAGRPAPLQRGGGRRRVSTNVPAPAGPERPNDSSNRSGSPTSTDRKAAGRKERKGATTQRRKGGEKEGEKKNAKKLKSREPEKKRS